MNKLGALLRTAQHFTAAQLFRKALYSASRKADGWLQRPLVRDNVTWVEFTDLRPITSRRETSAATEEARAFLDGYFFFAGEKHAIGNPIRWDYPEATPLWQYHIHYLDFLLPLAYLSAAGDSRAQFNAERVLASWLDAHTHTGHGAAWDPYPVSMRLRNLAVWGARAASAGMKQRLGPVTFAHAIWLRNRLEHHLRGNHLIRNYAALALAGLLLQCHHSESWLGLGLEGLLKESRRQVLPDGGHYERSPMYHLEVLEDFCLVQLVADNLGTRLPDEVRAVIARMARWAMATLCNDGDFPLFNDAALGQIAPTSEILALAGACCHEPQISELPGWRRALFARLPGSGQPLGMPPPIQTHLADSGFMVVRNEQACLQFDVGPIGASDQPGHAHSDTLSFELSIGSRRLVVDGGTSGYAGSPLRSYFRSTAAHNTVEVGGQSTDELWGAFRVGRVGRPLAARMELLQDGGYRLRGSYLSPQGWTHSRVISFWPNEGIAIEDDVCSPRHIRRPVLGRLHFEPSVQRIAADRLRLGGQEVSLVLPHGGAWFEAEHGAPEGWYAPRFGEPIACLTLYWPLSAIRRSLKSTIVLAWGGTLSHSWMERLNDH